MTDPAIMTKARLVLSDMEGGMRMRPACKKNDMYHSHFLKVVGENDEIRLRYDNIKKVMVVEPGRPVGKSGIPTIKAIQEQAILNVWEKVQNDKDGQFSLAAIRTLAQANVTDKRKDPLSEIDIDSFVAALAEHPAIMEKFSKDPARIKEAINEPDPPREDGDNRGTDTSSTGNTEV